MTLRQLLAAYQTGNKWVAFDNSKHVTATTERAARRELKASAATPRDREWNETDDTCMPLAREIAFLVCGTEPWDWGTVGGEADLSELTMRELVVLGKAIQEAAGLLAR